MKIYVKRVVEFLEDQPGNFNFDYVSEARRYESEETETQYESTLMNNLEERNYYNRNDITNIIQENKEIEKIHKKRTMKKTEVKEIITVNE